MEADRPEQGKVIVVTVEEVAEERRGGPEPPRVDPKVTPKQAVRALEKWPGGKEVIEQLRKEGYKI